MWEKVCKSVRQRDIVVVMRENDKVDGFGNLDYENF